MMLRVHDPVYIIVYEYMPAIIDNAVSACLIAEGDREPGPRSRIS